MRVNLVPESARHLEMTRARQMRVDTRDLAEADYCIPVSYIVLNISEIKEKMNVNTVAEKSLVDSTMWN